MALQQPRPGKCFATELALMVEGVGEHMHREGRHADIHLVTDVALLGIVRVKAPVSLPMSLEVAAGCIMFSTVTAGVFCLLP